MNVAQLLLDNGASVDAARQVRRLGAREGARFPARPPGPGRAPDSKATSESLGPLDTSRAGTEPARAGPSRTEARREEAEEGAGVARQRAAAEGLGKEAT